MIDLVRLLSEQVLLLACGSTLLLGIGATVVAMCDSPAHRQRLAELTVAGVIVWLVLVLVPLPRFTPRFTWSLSDASSCDIVILHAVGETAPAEVSLNPQPLPQKSEISGTIANQHSFTPVDESVLLELPSPSTLPATTEPTDVEQIQPPTNVIARQTFWPSMLRAIPAIYLASAAICVLLLLAAQALLLWLRAFSQRPPAWLESCYQELAQKSDAVPVTLLTSRYCSRPISWSVFWPVILLPQRLCCTKNRKQVSAILTHELGHIARRDALGNLLFCIALPVLYCHPLFWWLRRDWTLSAELLADDWAAWQTGKDVYVEELIDLARAGGSSRLSLVGVSGVLSSPSQFYRRMQMLLAREKPLVSRTPLLWQVASLALAVVGVVVASSVSGVRPAVAQTVAEAVDETHSDPPKGPETPAVDPPAVPPQAKSLTPAINEETVTDPRVRRLEDEKAALQAQIRALQDRLDKLDGAPMPENVTKTPNNIPIEVKETETVVVTRFDRDGNVWSETWTVDEHGKPGKLIERKAGAPTPARKVTGQPIDPSRAHNRRMGVVPAAPRDTVETTDREDEAPGVPFRTVPSSPNYGSSSRPVANASQQPARGQQLDLLSFATSYADAVSEVELAEAQLADLEVQSRLGYSATPIKTITTARLAVTSAKRKEQLLKRIATTALDSVTKEFERTKLLHKQRAASAAELDEVSTRREILKQILSTNASEKGPSEQGDESPNSSLPQPTTEERAKTR